MSFRALYAVALLGGDPFRDQPTMQATLYRLAHHLNWRTGACYPSHQTIADGAGITRRSVIRAIQTLKDAGLIDVIDNTRGGRSNAYRLLFIEGAFAAARIDPFSLPEIENESDTMSPNGDASVSDTISHQRAELCVTPFHLDGDTMSHKPGIEPGTLKKGKEREEGLARCHSGELKAASKKERERAIPDGFPTEREILREQERARAARVNINVRAEADLMRDWAAAGGRRCVDWDARWRMWMSKAIKDRGGDPTAKPEAPAPLLDVQNAPPKQANGADLADKAIMARDPRTLTTPAEQQAFVAHRRMEAFVQWAPDQREGRWLGSGDLGPPPGTAGCRIPPEIQRAHGVEPWNP